MAFVCNDISGCPIPSALHPRSIEVATVKQEIGWPKDGISGLGSTKVTAWVLGYYFLSLVLQTVLPGVESEGVELQSGGRLKYKFNGIGVMMFEMVEWLAKYIQHSALPR